MIFIHGFTSAKEHNLHIAYLLAEKGFRAVLPEALHHGERGEEMAVEELAGHFWDIVLNEIEEIGVLKNHFEKEAYFRENFLANGKFLDTEVYSLIKSNV